jgi:hypothetical protein
MEAPNPSPQALSTLVGEWTTEATHPMFPRRSFRDEARSSGSRVRGSDRAGAIRSSRLPRLDLDYRDTGGLRMHYFDSRGVARICELTVDGPVWRFSRTAPDFSPLNFKQRLTWTFSNDVLTIRGTSQICDDGKT